MSNLATDTFTGTNGAAWSATWTTGRDGGGGGTATIQSNAGRILVGTSPDIRTARRVNITAPVDAVALFKFKFNAATPGNCFPQYFVRSTNTTLDTQGGYRVLMDRAGSWEVAKSVSYSQSALTNTLTGTTTAISKTFTDGVWYWVRFGAVGSAIKARVWDDGSGEPGSWQWESTDTTYTTAGSGTGITVSGATSVQFDMDDFSLDTVFPGTAHSADATNTLTLTQTSTTVSSRPIDGTNVLTLTQTGNAVSARLVDGTNALALTQTGSVLNAAKANSTNVLTLAQTAIASVSSANIVSADALNPLTVTQTGNAINSTTAAGVNSLNLSQVGSAILGKSLDGVANALTFTQTAAVRNNVAAPALNTLTFGQTASTTQKQLLTSTNTLVLAQLASATVVSSSGGESVSTGGGWGTLMNIIAQNREYRLEEETRIPLACPNDGEPLSSGTDGSLRCRFDGWVWDGRPIRY
jgi:hypothetical protein